ncbi:MAG: MarR family winged helix-turn-helix transcriptional regulator [Gaiellaceae bacterium]
MSFLRAHASITRELSARLEAAHGLTLNDYDVLVQLAYAPGRQLRRVDLARSVLLSPSGITRLLDGLEREGWVAKGECPSDARVTYAVLTDGGLAKFKAVRKTHLVDIETVFGSRFSPEELETVSTLLGRLLDSDEPAACLKEPS